MFIYIIHKRGFLLHIFENLKFKNVVKRFFSDYNLLVRNRLSYKNLLQRFLSTLFME